MITELPLLAWPLQQVLSILIFHRVLPASDPFRPDEPTAVDFDKFLCLLSRNFRVLPLKEAVMLLRESKLPRRACCITFDDGYADNFNVALPILEKYRLPATIFVATGYLDGGCMFNDAVINSIATTDEKNLDLSEIRLGSYVIETIDDRRMAISNILKQIKYREPRQRGADLKRLIELVGGRLLPENLMLTTNQVAEISLRGFEIGGHTVNHPILASITADEARKEMLAGKQRLESIIGKPVRSFAYPNGRPHSDYSIAHVEMARDIGFDLAVTTAHGVGNPASDIYQLPRFTPWGKSMMMRGARMVRNAMTGKAESQC